MNPSEFKDSLETEAGLQLRASGELRHLLTLDGLGKEQVTNGVAVRMAVPEHVCQGMS